MPIQRLMSDEALLLELGRRIARLRLELGAAMTVAAVELWGTRIGAVALSEPSGVQLAPLMMPLAERVYSFPELPHRFGNNLINAWLARQGRTPESFDAVEHLCYTGQRGMGALEFKPAQGPSAETSKPIQDDPAGGHLRRGRQGQGVDRLEPQHR